jgi:hypothetical protein
MAIGLSAVILTSAAAQTQQKDTDRIRHLELNRNSWFDYRGCPPDFKCAAVGDPYRYNFYSAKDITDAAISAIQSFGFAWDPNSPRPTFNQCETKAEKSNASNGAVFWTDYIVLSDAFLSRIGVKWDQLNIVTDSHTHYQFRIVGCYTTISDGEYAPFARAENGDIIPLGDPILDRTAFSPLYDTRIDLVMKIDMQYRWSKSGFIDVPTSIYPKALVDVIEKQIDDTVQYVNAKQKDIGTNSNRG